MTREQIRARHRPMTGHEDVCVHDGDSWPCDATRALDDLDAVQRHADADHVTLARVAALAAGWVAQADDVAATGDAVDPLVVEAALRVAAKRIRQVLGADHVPLTVDEVAVAILAAWDRELGEPKGGHSEIDQAQAGIAALAAGMAFAVGGGS